MHRRPPSPTLTDPLFPCPTLFRSRLSHGHIRYGSFQRFAYLGESENIARLADYSLQHLLNDRPSGDDAAPRLLDHAVKGAARLVASSMPAGFVPGLLHTYNISITAIGGATCRERVCQYELLPGVDGALKKKSTVHTRTGGR